MKTIFALLFILTCGCADNKVSEPTIEITDQLLNKVVTKYIDYISELKEKGNEKVITVAFSEDSDTVSIAIANSYPDLSLANFNGYLDIKNYRVFLVGNVTKNFFFKRLNRYKIPSDVISANNMAGTIDSIKSSEEPTVWFLNLINGNLISYFPKEPMNRVIKDL